MANASVDQPTPTTSWHLLRCHCRGFAIFGSWYTRFPKMTGYMYSETLGKLHFG
jgi:cytochrome c oxidase subunit 1